MSVGAKGAAHRIIRQPPKLPPWLANLRSIAQHLIVVAKTGLSLIAVAIGGAFDAAQSAVDELTQRSCSTDHGCHLAGWRIAMNWLTLKLMGPQHAEGRAARRGLALATAVVAAALIAPASAQTPVKFSLDWKFEGPAAPFTVAIDKGFFKAEGLDVTIDTAPGSLEPLNRVASGTYDIGIGDINSLIKFRDANPTIPLKAVFMFYNKPAFAIVGRKSLGITKPKDLEGKKLGAPAPDGAYAQWKIFVQANQIDASKVTIENVGFPVREPMLQKGQVDAITGFSFSSFINLKSMGVPADDIVVMLMADYGVNLYGNAVFVNPKFAAEKPEAVKAFLRGLTKGIKETVKDPETAVDSVIKRNDVASKPVELERLKMAIKDNIVTDETKANGFGAVDMDRLTKSIDQIALTYEFKNGKPKAADIFDASMLPALADRKN
jgi:NitT/TauT family transport system substrate-binding protein